jgi:hypothetical protein
MDLGTSVSEMRPFLPARDFALSQEFYRVLGFRETWSSDQLAIMQLGRFSFFLQNYFVKEWADNTVIGLQVADADACWAYLQSLNLSERFGGCVRVGPPQTDASTRVRRGHFVDPAGVLWHFSHSLE